jgi:hypothetical protein
MVLHRVYHSLSFFLVVVERKKKKRRESKQISQNFPPIFLFVATLLSLLYDFDLTFVLKRFSI